MKFKDAKGNCVHRLDVDGIDHCMYHDDDCEEPCCPRVKEPSLFINGITYDTIGEACAALGVDELPGN